jgi:hypothetical protein
MKAGHREHNNQLLQLNLFEEQMMMLPTKRHFCFPALD